MTGIFWMPVSTYPGAEPAEHRGTERELSSWEENKRRRDASAEKENEKHKKEIVKLEKAARQAKAGRIRQRKAK